MPVWQKPRIIFRTARYLKAEKPKFHRTSNCKKTGHAPRRNPVFFAMLYEYSLPAEGPGKALLSNQSACFVLAMTISRTQTSCGIW